MAIVLSHISALEYWRSSRTTPRRFIEVARAKNLIGTAPKLDFGTAGGPFWISKPLHVLVGDASLRRSTKSITSHVWRGPLPKGYIFDAGNGFYVISPELCFLQMAEAMTLIELIELGFEFCGTYDTSSGEIQSSPPLTTVERLTAFVKKAEKIRGSATALRALPHIIGNSASPMETVLALLLCLPYRRGGYGLPAPLMNHRIDGGKGGTVPGSYYVCDLYWPEARLAVEYDSDSFHSGKTKLTKDSMRRSDLAFLGITVMSVTRQQLISNPDMHKLAQTFARHIGHSFRYKEPNFTEARNELRRTLLGARRF